MPMQIYFYISLIFHSTHNWRGSHVSTYAARKLIVFNFQTQPFIYLHARFQTAQNESQGIYLWHRMHTYLHNETQLEKL